MILWTTLKPFSVFGFRFSVKKGRIISKLKLKFVAFETELETSAKRVISYQTEQKEAEEMVGSAHPTFLKLI
jgi:hypothetical protein